MVAAICGTRRALLRSVAFAPAVVELVRHQPTVARSTRLGSKDGPGVEDPRTIHRPPRWPPSEGRQRMRVWAATLQIALRVHARHFLSSHRL